MRPVLQSDVTAAARALLAVPGPARQKLCTRLLYEADCADRFTRRLGKPHPFWGNGTLLAAARGHPLVEERTFDDRDYCSAFEMVLAQLLARMDQAHL